MSNEVKEIGGSCRKQQDVPAVDPVAESKSGGPSIRAAPMRQLTVDSTYGKVSFEPTPPPAPPQIYDDGSADISQSRWSPDTVSPITPERVQTSVFEAQSPPDVKPEFRAETPWSKPAGGQAETNNIDAHVYWCVDTIGRGRLRRVEPSPLVSARLRQPPANSIPSALRPQVDEEEQLASRNRESGTRTLAESTMCQQFVSASPRSHEIPTQHEDPAHSGPSRVVQVPGFIQELRPSINPALQSKPSPAPTTGGATAVPQPPTEGLWSLRLEKHIQDESISDLMGRDQLEHALAKGAIQLKSLRRQRQQEKMEKFVAQRIHSDTKLKYVRQGVEAGDVSVDKLTAFERRYSCESEALYAEVMRGH
ncbi:hypothetical protein DL98DRAFT_651329 [Cadophora sp. DSE1049]|nr:hypothetical protein DL98DRAFT_651329 [Cadophora sp. DSE1049]